MYVYWLYTYFSTHIFDLDIRHPITSETHWPCRLIWVLVLRWKCSLHYTFSKNNLHTNLINNTVTMYKLVSLNWNSLEHYNLVTTTKNRQSFYWHRNIYNFQINNKLWLTRFTRTAAGLGGRFQRMKPAFLRGLVNRDPEPGSLPRISPCFGVYHQRYDFRDRVFLCKKFLTHFLVLARNWVFLKKKRNALSSFLKIPSCLSLQRVSTLYITSKRVQFHVLTW